MASTQMNGTLNRYEVPGKAFGGILELHDDRRVLKPSGEKQPGELGNLFWRPDSVPTTVTTRPLSHPSGFILHCLRCEILTIIEHLD